MRPFRILIEAKYLRQPIANARKELVNCVYEALFYRGLAPVNDCDRQWEYDYAVALVYDGTPNAAFLRACNELPSDVQNALWNAANIFVMPLRGHE
jgi:hypothetical protein